MKKIISLISSLTLIFSMMTIAKAETTTPKAFVTVTDQTDTEITLALGVDPNGTGIEYFKSIYLQVSIPASILDTSEDVYANKSTSKAMFVASNPTNKTFKFNANIWSYKYEAFGSVNGDMNYDTDSERLILSQAIADGASLPTDGILAVVTLPLKNAISEDVTLTIPNASINTTDFETDVKYGYGDSDVIGSCAGVLSVVGDTLEGSAVELTGTQTVSVGEITIDATYTNPYIKITLGDAENNYFLPSDVKGDAKVHGFLKYDADKVTEGTFDVDLYDNLEKKSDIATINAATAKAE